MSGGGGSGSTTVQKADPWSGLQPYLGSLYSAANSLQRDQPASSMVAQNSGVAPLGQTQMDALNAVLGRAYNGSPTQLTFGNNATAMSNGTDQVSQMLTAQANGQTSLGGLLDMMARGDTKVNSGLMGIANGTDQTASALQNIGNGQGTAAQTLASVAGGNDATSQYLKSVLGGQYLNASSNPYLSGAVDAASSDATRNFQTAVMPQLASQFSLAGRYGSGAQSQGVSDATNNLAQQLSNTAAGIYNTNYQNERGNQQSAANTLGGLQTGAASALGGLQSGALSALLSGKNNALGQVSTNNNTGANLLSGYQTGGLNSLASRTTAGTQLLPQTSEMEWNNLNQGMNAASILQQQAQDQLTGNNALYAANQQQPYNQLSWLNGILSGGMSLNGQSSSSQQNTNPFRSAIGGGLSGAATGAAIGSMFGPGIGTGIGAAIGGGAGLLMGVL